VKIRAFRKLRNLSELSPMNARLCLAGTRDAETGAASRRTVFRGQIYDHAFDSVGTSELPKVSDVMAEFPLQ
jgi:hypothetical protein